MSERASWVARRSAVDHRCAREASPSPPRSEGALSRRPLLQRVRRRKYQIDWLWCSSTVRQYEYSSLFCRTQIGRKTTVTTHVRPRETCGAPARSQTPPCVCVEWSRLWVREASTRAAQLCVREGACGRKDIVTANSQVGKKISCASSASSASRKKGHRFEPAWRANF